ncbi:hypothetical protein DF020_16300 [Burkholderia cenocepacia]|nr:hypothetical protein WJ11_24105 [Burkholderia cenocepacia]RQV57305.1 hypothetical protein DF020_16300 [Burkholderia cenocepacia]
MENDVKKLAVALVASMLVTATFAQASAPAVAPAKAGAKAKKHKPHSGKSFTLDKSKLDSGDKLQ